MIPARHATRRAEHWFSPAGFGPRTSGASVRAAALLRWFPIHNPPPNRSQEMAQAMHLCSQLGFTPVEILHQKVPWNSTPKIRKLKEDGICTSNAQFPQETTSFSGPTPASLALWNFGGQRFKKAPRKPAATSQPSQKSQCWPESAPLPPGRLLHP